MFSSVRFFRDRIKAAGPRGWTLAAAAVTVLALACAGLAGAFSGSGSGPGGKAAGAPAGNSASTATGPASGASQAPRDHGAQGGGTKLRPASSASQHNSTQAAPAQPASAHPAAPHSKASHWAARHHPPRAHASQAALRTSCRAVAHIGDSTSVGLISPDYLPDPAQRLRARYAAVGVRSVRVDASGGRSIVETMPGQTNGYGVASAWASQGYRGCWVIALGTNDTANVSVGSAVGRLARIERMMSAAHGQPVLWVNVKTLDAAGPWAESSMQVWNATLDQACARYPNLRIFDWAAVANDGWFISDGIHYTSTGYSARGRLIALALAKAFPRTGHSHGCVVR